MRMVSERWPVAVALALGLALAMLAFAASAKPATPSCGSFSSQAEAEKYFLAAGGSPSRGVGDLDPDRDGAACESLPAPYAGYATIGYNRAQGFLFGTATMPADGGGFACLYGNKHFPDAPRKVTIFQVRPGSDRSLVGEYSGAAAGVLPASGRLVWKVEKPDLRPGRYYATFQERVRTHPYGANECPGFSSQPTELPRPRNSR